MITREELLWREIAALKRQLDALTTREAPAAWIADNRVFSYASATTVTTPGDITAQYGAGTKLRWKQTGDTNYRYGYLTAASYGAPNTTLTLTGGSDYSVANAAITEWGFSYAALPPGFPAWHNYTVAWTCLSGGNPAIGNGSLVGKFRLIGRTVEVLIDVNWGSTTTNGGGIYQWTLPVGALTTVANSALRGEATLLRAGADTFLAFPKSVGGATLIGLQRADNTYITNAAIYAWTNGDWFSIDFCYPLA